MLEDQIVPAHWDRRLSLAIDRAVMALERLT